VRRQIAAGALLAALLAPAPLAGCASSNARESNAVDTLSGRDALTRSLAAADSQDSVRMVTKGSREDLPFAVDMRLRRNGGGSGTVWIGSQELSVVTTTSEVFIKADTAYWSTQMEPSFAKAIGGMWVKAPISSTSFASFALLGSFDRLLTTYLRPSGPATRGDASQILDSPAVPVVTTEGSVWIASTGAPLPVQVDTPSTGDVIRFGEWGRAVDVPVPPTAQTVDLGAVGVK
jgi:hypothetical protein